MEDPLFALGSFGKGAAHAPVRHPASVRGAQGRRPQRPDKHGAGAVSAGLDPAAELLVGQSPAMTTLRDIVRRVASADATVLVSGPTGAGKENVARALHLLSPRATCPFVAVNCGAIPADLAESELFGAEAGAFTGATRARPGAFEQAHGGTLFLDELGELSPALQVKLLRVLETREVNRLGGGAPRRLDVRVVAATNRDLEAEVEAGRFRADLYWRLAVVCLDVPPLVGRPEDVSALLAHLAGRAGGRLALTECGAAALAAHDWPGNVRELRNFAERVLALGEAQVDAAVVARFLGRRHQQRAEPLPAAAAPLWPAPSHGGCDAWPSMPPERIPPAFQHAEPLGPAALKELLREAEAALIAQALDAAGGTVAQAGRILGMKRTTLVEKMKRMGLRPPANEAA
ncbi:MAG: sigma-54 interaction domain-containing protein [Thermaurantiacus sp.]